MIYVIIAIQIVKNAQLHLIVSVLHAMEVFSLMDLHVIAHVQTKIHMETQLIILAKLAIPHVKPVMEELLVIAYLVMHNIILTQLINVYNVMQTVQPVLVLLI